MQDRLARLNRLANMYAVVERVHSIELQTKAAALVEAERAIEVQRVVVRSAGFDGREALGTGDRMGWSVAQAQREIAGWRRDRLERIRAERMQLSDTARERYLASRLESEQMKSVVGRAAARVQVEEGRRTQATSDDRFLSRKAWIKSWMDAREESRRDR